MEILIGLAIASVLVLGWFYGNLLACIFLTLGSLCIGGFGLILADNHHPEAGAWITMASLALLCITWAPRYYWCRAIDTGRP